MLGSPNGPAYGSQPKLVVMKVLCKLRWKKIRHPLIFPHSLSLSSFILCIPLSVSSSLFIFSSALNLFDKVRLSLCLPPSSPLFPPLLLFFICFTFSLSSCPSYPPPSFMPSWLFVFLILFHAHCLLCLFTKIDLSLICCLSLYIFRSTLSVVFLRHA